MVTINKATMAANIWKTIFDRIKDQVTSVTTAATATFTVQTWTSAFPHKSIDTKSDYPIVLINPVDLSWTPHTLTKKHATGTCSIDIYVTDPEAADLFLDKIIKALEEYRETAFNLGLEFFELQSTSADSFPRGGFNVNVRSATFSFKIAFTKTAR